MPNIAGPRHTCTYDGRARGDCHSMLFTVRAFYRDRQQCALEDSARWAEPPPLTSFRIGGASLGLVAGRHILGDAAVDAYVAFRARPTRSAVGRTGSATS